jgi:hypothetical protein
MIMKDEFGGADLYARMDLTDAASLANPSISTVLIIKYGAHPLINDIEPPRPRTPEGYFLAQNYPNPFNPTTNITFSTDQEAEITVAVYDVLGREIAVVARGTHFPGLYTVRWDGRSALGESVPSGVYYFRMTADPAGGEGGSPYAATRKMLLLK